MNKIADYKKDKRRAATGIGAAVFLLVMGLIGDLTGLFFYLDSVAAASQAQGRKTAFDPWEDSSSGIQNSWKTWEIVGLTDEFAADFKETYHYYFAFDPDWYLTIVKMKGELGEEFQPCLDFVYEDEAEEPEPVRVRGVAVPIEDDIREYAIECLNILYDDEDFMTEEYFEDYMGVSLLDTTQKPVGRAMFSGAAGFAIFGVIVTALGIFFLVVNIKKRSQACLAEEREKENMRRMAAWQNGPGEDGSQYRWTAGGETGGGSQGSGAWPGSGGNQGGTWPGTDSVQGSGAWQGQGNSQGSGAWQGAQGTSAYEGGWPGGAVATGSGQGGSGFGAGGQTGGADGVRLTPVKKSNVFLGIIGAIGGSLVGVVLWVGISIIGFIAGIAGFVMLKFALKGYEKLSGKLDQKGAVISLLVTTVMIFFANVVDYAVTLCQAFFQWDASLDTVRYVILNFGTLMTDADCWGGFMLNLMIGYALSIWASYGLIREILKYKEN